MKMKGEMKDEIQRDVASRFYAEQYVSNGYYMHCHRNIEIYGVVHGKVAVTIAGQKTILTDGQIAVINTLENHSYEIDGSAEVFFFHIGTSYCSKLYSLYPNKRFPYFLMDTEYNQRLYHLIRTVMGDPAAVPELRRHGITCQLFADIIEHYGVIDQPEITASDRDIISDVVQYIYEHYSEKITLESLSKVFYISPKALSKKISKRLNMDLRLFINDIRVQRVMQMKEDPAHKDKSLEEIALLCGFTNMVTFYRSYDRNFVFKKLEEQTAVLEDSHGEKME